MKKLTDKFIGTFPLVLFSCGAAVIVGIGGGATSIEVLEISCAFGFPNIAVTDCIGPVSGCNVNPAVRPSVLTAGQMYVGDFIGYTTAQILDALAAAAILYLILSSKASGWTGGLSQNGWARRISANRTPSRPWCSRPSRSSSSKPIFWASRKRTRRRIWWCRHQHNTGFYPYRPHQRDRFVSGPNTVNWPGTRRHRRKRRSGIAALAVHRRANDRPRAPRA